MLYVVSATRPCTTTRLVALVTVRALARLVLVSGCRRTRNCLMPSAAEGGLMVTSVAVPLVEMPCAANACAGVRGWVTRVGRGSGSP